MPLPKDKKTPQRLRNPRRIPWLVGLIVAVVALGAWLARTSAVQVGEKERAFRVTSLTGGLTRLSPGRHLVVPVLQRLLRLPDGPIHVASSARVRTREGVDLEVPFEVEGRLDDEALGRWLARGAGAPDEAARSAAEEAVAAWGQGTTAESLVLGEGSKDAETKLQAGLDGWTGVTLKLGRVRGTGGTAEAIAAKALRQRVQPTGVKVAILGLDGADWEIIDPLMARGLLPNLARLKARGAWGNMKTLMPWLSPLLWTSVATGKSAEEHGIVDFLIEDARTGQAVPVSSRW